MRRLLLGFCFVVLATGSACGAEGGDAAGGNDTGESTDVTEPDAAEADVDAGEDESAERSAALLNNFGSYTLDAGEEALPCAQWTLDNEEPVYVDTLTLSNDGAFHHSNWYVVPEHSFDGGEGYFECDEGGLSEFDAAVQGTVLFAQSTQAHQEVQDLAEGVVVKIPPKHRIVGFLHMLNAAPREIETGLRMQLDLIHPGEVETVVTPFALTYRDLHIPPESESRFTGECVMATSYEDRTDEPFDIDLYWVLPHYHELGNYFRLEVAGGERDGEEIYELSGFNAEPNGRAYNPPIDLSGADGLRFTCGYDNPRSQTVGWGIGDQEMCMMLGFADSEAVMNSLVEDTDITEEDEEGLVEKSGPCHTTVLPKGDKQSMPSDEEVESEQMYVPPAGTDEDDFEPVPDCEDTPEDAEAGFEPTLSSIESQIFAPSCSFSACHNSEAPAAALDLRAEDLHTELLEHEVLAQTDRALVEPGEPEESWLYRIMSECEPDAGGPVSHMPRNSPTLLEPELVATVRDWIEEGAKDN